MWTHNLGSGQLWYDRSLQVRAVIQQGVPSTKEITGARYVHVHRSISVAKYSKIYITCREIYEKITKYNLISSCNHMIFGTGPSNHYIFYNGKLTCSHVCKHNTENIATVKEHRSDPKIYKLQQNAYLLQHFSE